MIESARTPSGFSFGAALVECRASDEKKGWVIVGVKTPKQRLQIYVTKTGKVRVWNGNKEMKEST